MNDKTLAVEPAQRLRHPSSSGSMWASVLSTRMLTWVVFGALALFVLLSFGQHGISNDEEVQHIYGRLLLAYYQSGLTDLSAFGYKNLYLYGGLFDMLAALGEACLPLPLWDMRHLLSALFGMAGMVGVYRLGRHLDSARMGLLAVALLAVTGAWSGAFFTHTKDIPFAACMIWATYYTTRVVERLPAPPLSLVLKLGVAVGCAFGMRVGAVFSVMCLGLAVIASAALAERGWADPLRHLWRSVRALLPAAALALVLMALLWPWSVQSPLNLWRALTEFSHFVFSLETIVDGQVMKIADVPRSYLPVYLSVRMPELTLVGLVAALCLGGGVQAARLFAGEADARAGLRRWLPVLLAALLPLLLAVLTRPALYNGVRHFSFLLPPLALIAAAGLMQLGALMRRRVATRALFVLMLAAGLLDPLAALARLHPYEYVAYNRLVGGAPGAAGRWEMDYWSDGVREAAGMLERYMHEEPRRAEPWHVAVCAENIQADAYLGPEFLITKDWVRADFFIATTHMSCDTVLLGDTVGRVERDGVTLTVLKDRRTLHPAHRRPLR